MKISATQFEQSGIIFWSCILKCKYLVKIGYVARRADSDKAHMFMPNKEGAVQRLLNQKRIKSIKNFVLEGGMFPNGIILNWTSDDLLRFNNNHLELQIGSQMAQIIDGQHRIAGINAALKEKAEVGNIEIPTIFTQQLSTAKCAQIFLSINSEQKPVPKSLVYDLYPIAFPKRDYLIDRATDIAEKLNNDTDSPYRDYIKYPKTRRMVGGIPLSVVVTHLKKFIKKTDGVFEKYQICTLEKQTKVLFNYFSVFETAYGQYWTKTSNPFIFATGFNAALDILRSDLLQLCFAKKDFSKEMFFSLLKFDKTHLIEQSEIKGLSGDAAKEKITKKLKSFLNNQNLLQEDDFKF
ncbi:MAG: DGQHR domain-containing protein [Thiomargarita sp.]|nr:DGQHR domain-containing protein [Thiomargarita sp.]